MEELLDPTTPVFGLSARQIGRQVQATARALPWAKVHQSQCRVGMAQDLGKSWVELPALMQAGRCKSSKMPSRYTKRQSADRDAMTGITRKRKVSNHSEGKAGGIM